MAELSVDNFKDEVKGGTVLVDFWAPWCAPCKALMPHIDALTTEMPDVRVIKVDVDQLSDLAEQLNVRSVPTLILYKDGVEVKRRTGAMSKPMLTAFCS